jgi:predicted O-linked N-acetylglucosamine transferase (SPINDLY family)
MLWRLISGLWRRGDPAPPLHTKTADAPGTADGWLARAEALHARGELAAALECYRACAALDPHNVRARSGIAHVLSASWRMEECIEACADTLEAAPGNLEIFSGYLLYSHYTAHPDANELFALHQRCGASIAQASPPLYTHDPQHANPARTLRIGYVSRDFCAHSVASFVEPVLARHDRSQHTVHCYYTRAHSDAVTERFASLADAWHDASHDTADALAARIHADGIDVLVDLGGHTLDNRLASFSRRPAPVQCTWLGYPDTTGLPAIDYRITDDIVDHGGADALHSERLLRLAPPFLCYQPDADAPPVATRPTDGPVVFGSFNVIMKVNEPLIDLWTGILTDVPGSRLMLKSTLLEYAETAARVRDRFAERGITADRLDLRPWTGNRAEHLATYGDIDIALDTFPYNGTTTTCEALWMGVPVVTLRGGVHMSRVGASLLASIGLEMLVAAEPEQYATIAVDLAREPSLRRTLRAGMRARLEASPLLDAAGFARKLENAYRQAWSAWCVS